MTERRRGPAIGALSLSAVLAVSGCAGQASVTTTPAASSTRSTAPSPSVPLTPSAGATTPMTDPKLDAIAQALGDQGRGAYRDVYSDLIVDTPPGAVTLYVTDAVRGRKLIAAAKKAHPDINTGLVRIVHARFTRMAIDAQIQRIIPATINDTPIDPSIYTASANPDGSGITVTVAKAKVAAIHAKLNALITTPTGIPVTLIAGYPLVPK